MQAIGAVSLDRIVSPSPGREAVPPADRTRTATDAGLARDTASAEPSPRWREAAACAGDEPSAKATRRPWERGDGGKVVGGNERTVPNRGRRAARDDGPAPQGAVQGPAETQTTAEDARNPAKSAFLAVLAALGPGQTPTTGLPEGSTGAVAAGTFAERIAVKLAEITVKTPGGAAAGAPEGKAQGDSEGGEAGRAAQNPAQGTGKAGSTGRNVAGATAATALQGEKGNNQAARAPSRGAETANAAGAARAKPDATPPARPAVPAPDAGGRPLPGPGSARFIALDADGNVVSVSPPPGQGRAGAAGAKTRQGRNATGGQASERITVRARPDGPTEGTGDRTGAVRTTPRPAGTVPEAPAGTQVTGDAARAAGTTVAAGAAAAPSSAASSPAGTRAAGTAQPGGPPAGNVADQVAEGIRTAGGRTGREVTVRLHPPELGRVRIVLRSEGDAIRGVVRVETPETLSRVQQEAAPLLQRLQGEGIDLRRLDVMLNQQGQDGTAGQDSAFGQDRGDLEEWVADTAGGPEYAAADAGEMFEDDDEAGAEPAAAARRTGGSVNVRA